MLRPPHSRYQRIYVYHLDTVSVPDIQDPAYIGGWREGDTAVLFFHQEREAVVADICRGYGCQVVYQADLDYKDWETGEEIAPFSVGPLTVAPVWESAQADIFLDPSVIFGNGFHPTTRLCLEALCRLAADPGVRIDSALDLGCGTGLLGISAARLGISRVMALDENSLACRVAEANILRNHVEDRVRVLQQDFFAAPPETEGVDLVMANLFHDLLETLFHGESFWQAKYYILSGFFAAREEQLRRSLPGTGFVLRSSEIREKWGIWVIERQ